MANLNKRPLYSDDLTYAEFKAHIYLFEAVVDRIVDGDSFYCWISRGFYDQSYRSVRLARVDAYETTGKEKEKGILAKNFVESLIAKGDKIIIKSLNNDAFGRVVAEVWIDLDNRAVNLSNLLVKEKHAAYKHFNQTQLTNNF